MGRPTVLLADQKKTIQGILRYEGNNQLSDLKIDTFPYVIGSAADCPVTSIALRSAVIMQKSRKWKMYTLLKI